MHLRASKWFQQWSHMIRYGLFLIFYVAAIVEWLRSSTRIYKILDSNLSIIIHGTTLDKLLTTKLSRMTHSYSASVSTLDGRGADTGVRKKKKTVETGSMWILIITAAGTNER